MREDEARALSEFYEVIERLRAPGGCPWDREQTHKTLAPYLIEEAYELIDAINSNNSEALREELGDVLLQVFMHSVIAAETGKFDIGDVAAHVQAKMIHRHPHVFGEAAVNGAADVVVNWEKLKAQEKNDRDSLLDGIPRTLPSLAYAQAVQKRPARIGLDQWSDIDDVIASLRTALDRLQVAANSQPKAQQGEDWVIREGEIARGDDAGDAQAPQPSDEVAELVGELIWVTVAISRKLRINAEDALRQSADEHVAEFRTKEAEAKLQGHDIHEISVETWNRIESKRSN